MKKQTKTARAYRLFVALGSVDDRLLQEALTYRPARAHRPRTWLLAACLCLSLVLVMGTLLLPRLAPQPNESESDALALDALLLNASAERTVADPSMLDTSRPALVWQGADSEALCVVSLTNAELARLQARLGGKEVGEESPTQKVRVWLVGDGEVISPYLRPTSGNVGVTLFDYEPELLPSDSFVDCLSEILND